MAETVVIDLDLPRENMKKNPSVKRKRDNQISMAVVPGEREAKIRALNEEIQSLIKYFKELVSENGVATFTASHFQSYPSSNVNVMIALLLEEKSDSYLKLSSEIFEKLKERDSTVTIASVKSNVLNVGRRVCYGVQIDGGDVLEDETESCLWCWETREMKLLPAALRNPLKVRRTCRRKITERITAISALLSLLQNPMECQTYNKDLRKASDKLSKVLNEADIRSVAESSSKVDGSEMADKGAKRKEKLLIKQLEKIKRKEEKEKKRINRDHQKEKLQSEKELKRLQEEAEKEEKRREKEESEMRKQLKRKQEDLERDQRRREKEEAEQKKQRTIQKQASIMQRFLHLKKNNSPSTKDDTLSNPTTNNLSNRSENKHEPATLSMDCALSQNYEIDTEDIRNSHLDSWRCLGNSTRHGKRHHWGIRQKPKTAVINELKLSGNKGPEQDDDLSNRSPEGGWEETNIDDKTCITNVNSVIGKCNRSKKLLQFDKSHRPAFYGVWPKKSQAIGPRHPFKRDPELDYDIDSDEEWEEEEPGESLSECEKDEEEILDDGSLKADDEDESGDGFFVPDGYLSENEGVQSDRSPCNLEEDDAGLPHSSNTGVISEEIFNWVQQLKRLHNLTEHALRKNQPLIIANTRHEKSHLLCSDNLTGTPKIEQMCLQALAMRPFPDGLIVEVHSDDNLQSQEQEICSPTKKGHLLPAESSMSTISDSDLSKIVSVIQSCPYGMNKVLESLLQKFPKTSKSQLRNKVREISDFVDNRWQVKKEILDKLGLLNTPEKRSARTTNIAAFFSKRCMPPSRDHPDPTKTSPELIRGATLCVTLEDKRLCHGPC
ncbi:hypothetical protein V2J09_000902 [Rumex salicifolius]